MLPDNTSERTWLIDQYLAGNLTDEQQQRVDQRRQTDGDFDRQVLAHWLVHQYLEQEQDTIAFNKDMAELGTELAQQKRRYNTVKGTRFLIQVLLPGLAVACIGLIVWLSWPPTGQVGEVPITNTDGTQFDGLALVVVRYDHAPGLLGRWHTEGQYRWPGDTLFLYGKPWQQAPPNKWVLTRIDEQGHYTLRVAKQTYTLLDGQTELTNPPTK